MRRGSARSALSLTPTEFRLLEALVRAGGDIVPHLQLARAGWPAETDPDLLWLKPHLARLRSKAGPGRAPGVASAGRAGPCPARRRGYRDRASDRDEARRPTRIRRICHPGKNGASGLRTRRCVPGANVHRSKALEGRA